MEESKVAHEEQKSSNNYSQNLQGNTGAEQQRLFQINNAASGVDNLPPKKISSYLLENDLSEISEQQEKYEVSKMSN